jgi:prepilin-type N-terminal cleavage/methylation domain-containing protein
MTRAPRRAGRRIAPGDQRGFTIIETMAAILILAVAFLGFAGTHAISSRAQSLGENLNLATNVIDQRLALMHRQTYAGITSGSATSTTMEGIPFSYTRTVTDVGNGKRVSVSVTWTDRQGNHTMTLATVVSQVTNP